MGTRSTTVLEARPAPSRLRRRFHPTILAALSLSKEKETDRSKSGNIFDGILTDDDHVEPRNARPAAGRHVVPANKMALPPPPLRVSGKKWTIAAPRAGSGRGPLRHGAGSRESVRTPAGRARMRRLGRYNRAKVHPDFRTSNFSSRN